MSNTYVPLTRNHPSSSVARSMLELLDCTLLTLMVTPSPSSKQNLLLFRKRGKQVQSLYRCLATVLNDVLSNADSTSYAPTGVSGLNRTSTGETCETLTEIYISKLALPFMSWIGMVDPWSLWERLTESERIDWTRDFMAGRLRLLPPLSLPTSIKSVLITSLPHTNGPHRSFLGSI